MMRKAIDNLRICLHCCHSGPVALAVLLAAIIAFGQEAQERKFYEVTLGAANCLAYDKLSYSGDYFTLTASQGRMVTGTTPVGVTVLILFGNVEFKISAAKDHEARFKEAFDANPVTLSAGTSYIRLNPADFKEMTKASKLTPLADEELLAQGKAIFEEKFKGSYHAGALAILPPEDTLFADLQTERFGQVLFEEGDYLRLIRVTPYKSVYPSRLLNPKRW